MPGAMRDKDGLGGRSALLVADGAADEAVFGNRHTAEHRSQLLKQRNKVRVEFGENVLIAHNLRQVSRPNLAEATRLPGRVPSPTSQE